MATVPTESPASTDQEESLQARFRHLAAAWNEATGFLSSMSEASKHPAYQEIIRLGPAVIPLLLRDMEENHEHWFIALREITGVNPIPESAAGNIPKMVRAWLDWAGANGYQW